MKVLYPRIIREASEIYEQFNYHRDFIKNFTEMTTSDHQSNVLSFTMRPASETFSEDIPQRIHKTQKQHCIPRYCKNPRSLSPTQKALLNASILIHLDFKKEFILYTDTCRKGIASSLYQTSDNGKEHSMLFIFCGLTDTETCFSATGLEYLMVM